MAEEEDKVHDDVCYCRCEGAWEHALGVCPLHMPKDHNEMRAIVKRFVDEAYQQGYDDAKEKLFAAFFEAMEEV